jgi:hypothetical protein
MGNALPSSLREDTEPLLDEDLSRLFVLRHRPGLPYVKWLFIGSLISE